MSNPIKGFVFNLSEITLVEDQEIGPFVFFKDGDKLGRYEVVSKYKNEHGLTVVNLKFIGYDRE